MWQLGVCWILSDSDIAFDWAQHKINFTDSNGVKSVS